MLFTPDECVRSGAILFDQKYPGWFKEVDLVTLDAGNECDCPGGQVAGSFAQCVCELGISGNEAEQIRLGLLTLKDDQERPNAIPQERRYELLTYSWKLQIHRRRLIAANIAQRERAWRNRDRPKLLVAA